jgi:hypothetical protein
MRAFLALALFGAAAAFVPNTRPRYSVVVKAEDYASMDAATLEKEINDARKGLFDLRLEKRQSSKKASFKPSDAGAGAEWDLLPRRASRKPRVEEERTSISLVRKRSEAVPTARPLGQGAEEEGGAHDALLRGRRRGLQRPLGPQARDGQGPRGQGDRGSVGAYKDRVTYSRQRCLSRCAVVW